MVTIKKKRLLGVACIIIGLGVLITGGVLLYNHFAHTSSQSDYPTLPLPKFADTIDLSLSDQVINSNLIVDATVANVLPEETRKYNPQAGTAEAKIYEKQGINESEYTLRPIEITINETLKGTNNSKTITMYIMPFGLDCSPNFKKGDHMIFMLRKNGDGGYNSVSLQDSYYYIAADNKVYPALVTDLTKTQSGKNLNDFKNDIKSLATKK